MIKAIKRILLFFAIISVTGITRVYSQQSHYIYIQADDKQQFSVNLKGKIFNASSVGYVIIPKLEDGKYMLAIGFPEKKFPDQEFECTISKSDVGYALKNFGKKGWGLFNLQTLDVTMAGAPLPEIKQDAAKATGFGDMLADVVNDSSIKIITPEKPVIVEKKQELPVVKADTATIVISENKLPVAVERVIKQVDSKIEIPTSKAVLKIFEQQTDLGTDMMFVVNEGEQKDTVRILLPQGNWEGKKTDQAQAGLDKTVPDSVLKAVTETKVVSVTEEINQKTLDTSSSKEPVGNPFFGNETHMETTIKTDIASDDKAIKNSLSGIVSINQNCKNMLSDEELNKLRKKMFSITGDQKMIDAAKKYFQNKCISAVQAKTLSSLFLSDESRYNFFETAFGYVYDASNFASLENQLIDPLYKKRFTALLK